MIEKLTITKIYRSWEDKNRQPLKTSDGRPYERVAIQAQERGISWISGFGGDWNKNWRKGDTIEVDVEPKGQYLNFRRPDKLKQLEDEMRNIVFNLEKRIVALEMDMETRAGKRIEVDVGEIPIIEDNPEETKNLPF